MGAGQILRNLNNLVKAAIVRGKGSEFRPPAINLKDLLAQIVSVNGNALPSDEEETFQVKPEGSFFIVTEPGCYCFSGHTYGYNYSLINVSVNTWNSFLFATFVPPLTIKQQIDIIISS